MALSSCTRSFLLSISVLVAIQTMYGQDPAAGILPFSSNAGDPVDSLDLATSGVLLTIPVRTKAGKIPIVFNLIYDSHPYVITTGNSGVWHETNTLSPAIQAGDFGVSFRHQQTIQTCGSDTHDLMYSMFTVVDPSGASHPLPSGMKADSDNCYTTTGDFLTTDGSGYTFHISSFNNYAIYDRSGNDGQGYSNSNHTMHDADGSTISMSFSGNANTYTITYTDSLNTTVLTQTRTLSGQQPTDTYTYADSNNATQTIQVNYSPQAIQTAFACSGINDLGPTSGTYLASSVSTPVGSYTVSYEPTPGHAANVTGRLAKVTLPTGGYVSYSYSGGNNGINCQSKVVPTMTRTIYDSVSGTSSTWTYTNTNSSSTPGNYTLTAQDPGANQTVYHFSGEYQTEKQVYQGTATGTPLAAVVVCYNGIFSNCIAPSSVPTLPMSRTDTYTSLNGSASALVENQYDSYGNITYQANYDYNQIAGATPTGTPLQAVTITYANPGSHIYNKPASVVIATNGSTSSQITFANYSSAGHVGTVQAWVGGSSWLSKSYTYNSNGTINTMTDVNSAQYAYAYNGTGGCNSLFQTSITVTGAGLPSGGLTNSTQWNCNGGVASQTTDSNQQTMFYNYNDPLWRLTSVQDPTGAETAYNYLSPTTEETVQPVNGSSSAVDRLTTLDGLGRAIFVQTRQAPASSSFDSIQYGYGWNSTGAVTTTSMPYVGGQAQSAPAGTALTTTQYEALGRVQSITDGGGGTLSKTYNKNDVLQTSPAPNKQKQFQYDGFGRVTSVCEVTTSLPGYGTCSQTSPIQGYYTTYSYSAGQTVLKQNVQGSPVQTRTYTFDGLGRMTSETNPESGTTTYAYDSATGTTCNQSYPGDMVKMTDANGNWICSNYDGIHRIVDVGNSAQGSTNPCKHFRYDNTTGVLGSIPSGITVNYPMGQRAEAETDNCAAWPGVTQASMITDEWSSYDKRGEFTDLYESTPHSGAYYHAFATYWPNDELNTLGGINNQSTMSYGVDGEGRVSSATQGSTMLVSNTSFNAASQVLTISFGNGDSDNYSYDPNTGRLTNYTFTVGSTPKSMVGGLNWNSDGTLQRLQITDGFNSSGTQTCTFGYDDLTRIASDNCGSVWSQMFSYDPFGNITKSGNSAWMPGYNESNNRYQLGGTSYDNDGQLLNDTFHTYSWNLYHRPATVDSTTALTYDALDRLVERSYNGSYATFQYSPIGKVTQLDGDTQTHPQFPLPGGAIYYPLSGALWHADWLGSIRFGSGYQSRSVDFDFALAPFGECYDQVAGSCAGSIFAGLTQDSVLGEYDTPARLMHPGQSRWISPDPAGVAATNPTNPQTLNRYAYVLNDPLSLTDPTGLFCEWTGENMPQFNLNSFDSPDLWNVGPSYAWDQSDCGSTGGWWTPANLGLGSPTIPTLSTILPGEDSVNTPLGSGNVLTDLWQDALGLPTVPCGAQFGPWCDPSKLPNWWILDADKECPGCAVAFAPFDMYGVMAARQQGCVDMFHHTWLGRGIQFGSLLAMTPIDDNYKKNWKDFGKLFTVKTLIGAGEYPINVVARIAAAKFGPSLVGVASLADASAHAACGLDAAVSTASIIP